MIQPDGRVILISGANRGIGLSVAKHLSLRGYSLSLGARNLDKLVKATADFPEERTALFEYDAGNKGDEVNWVSGTVKSFLKIDGLINNAGIAKPEFTLDLEDEAKLDKMIDINLKGPLRLIRNAMPYLKKSGQGRVINVSSLSGKRVRNSNVGYSMTKFGLVALTHTVRQEGWKYGIRATALCPSFVKTDLTTDVKKVSPDEMIQPRDLAELIDTILSLPNTASIAELLVNCRLEDTL